MARFWTQMSMQHHAKKTVRLDAQRYCCLGENPPKRFVAFWAVVWSRLQRNHIYGDGHSDLFTWVQVAVSLASLLFQLAFVAIVCLLGGLITSLVTWWMEDGIYRKIVQSRLPR